MFFVTPTIQLLSFSFPELLQEQPLPMETSLFSSAAAVASAMAAANGSLPHHQHHHLLPNANSPAPMASIPSPYSILAAAAASHGQPGT